MRQAVLRQISERDEHFPTYRVSTYPWRAVTRMQRYVRDLSPENLLDIRIHTDPFIGTLSANFWLTASAAGYESRYRYFGEGVPQANWAYEPELPGLAGTDYGYRVNGRLLSDVATEYQRYLCNLWRLGIFEFLQNSTHRPVVLEIGAGHGGFAQLFAEVNRFPHTYVIVDLPETLMFSAVFLTVHHPEKRIYTYAPGDNLERIVQNSHEYDFILVPDYQFPRLAGLGKLDLALNHVSFPEMPTETLRDYLRFIQSRLDGFIVSVNYRRVPATDRTFVDELLAEHFVLSPTATEFSEFLGENQQLINDINCRPTLVGSSSIMRRSQLAGRETRDIIGTSGQRYICQFAQDSCKLRMHEPEHARAAWRSRMGRLLRATPLIRRIR